LDAQGKLRAWWSFRQGLDGRYAGQSIATVLRETGWARSVGGVGPYLGLFARCGASREAVDAAIANIEIHELPAARGCTYVVPADDFALALKAGEGFSYESDMTVARKLGVTDKEIDKLCRGVVDSLQAGAMDPDALKSALGKAVRNLGEEGKKKGVTTTLPLALGRLQEEGEIRRIPMNGRLDQQRYRYALWHPNPLGGYTMSAEQTQTELARRYFSWIGPATLAEYQWFSAASAKVNKAAIEPLRLIDLGEGRLIPPEMRDEWESFKPPKDPQIALVSSIDGLALLRRDLPGMADAADLKRLTSSEWAGSGLKDLPSHAIVDRGRLIGLWEYDPDASSIAWMTFAKATPAVRQCVERTEAYVRDQLGDARSFSLDSPKSRAPRIAAIRKSA
jgi:Winged helix DNA-binding domain